MARDIAFSTFLKLVELDEARKLTMLRGFLRGGGFNYWRPLQILSEEIIQGKLDFENLTQKMDLFAKGHQKKYNQNALIKILTWKSKRAVAPRKRPEKFYLKFGSSDFRIKFEPELSFSLNGTEYFAHIWATNTPALEESTISTGLYALKRAVEESGYKNKHVMIIDTIKDKNFGEFDILSNSKDMFLHQSQIVDDLWKTAKEQGESRKKTGGDIHAPPPALN